MIGPRQSRTVANGLAVLPAEREVLNLFLQPTVIISDAVVDAPG
jgi:hypothetical protein